MIVANVCPVLLFPFRLCEVNANNQSKCECDSKNHNILNHPNSMSLKL